MKIEIILNIFILFVFFPIIVFAQNGNRKKTTTGNKTGILKTTAASGDSISFRDGDGNTLLKITDEGTTGSITIPSASSTPTATTNKLYNVGSTLYFNGSSLGPSGRASSINDLSDAKYDGYSLFIGSGAGSNDGGVNYNTAVGKDVLNLNTTGSNNTAIGYQALYSNTTGNDNTANGYGALPNNTTGLYNTATGYHALYSNTTGQENVANGYGALYSNTATYGNTAIGFNALYSNVQNVNTAIGSSALYSNTTGIENTATGSQALYSNTTGNYNTAIGYQALDFNTTGSENTAVGYGANVSSGNLTNATAIGFYATVNSSNTIQLGNSSITAIYAKVGITATSDSTKKENFIKVDGEKILEKYKNFRLTSWNFKGDDPKTHRHYGIMAQDFFSAFGHDAMGTIGNDTTINVMDESAINMIAIQTLEKRTTEQAWRISDLENKVKELEKQNEQLKMQNAEIKNEFDTIKLIVNKLADKKKRINVTLK